MLKNIDKFTQRCQSVLKNSQTLALQLGKKEVGVEEVWLALSQYQGSMAAEILAKAKGKTSADQIPNNESLSSFSKVETDIPFSETIKKAIEKSIMVAAEFNQLYIGTEHLLYALLIMADQTMDKILVKDKLDRKKILEQLKIVFSATANFSVMGQLVHKVGEMTAGSRWSSDDFFGQDAAEADKEAYADLLKEMATNPHSQEKDQVKEKNIGQRQRTKSNLLDFFATNLTEEKIQQKIDPVIGREKEIQRLIQILLRRTKNNPVLLGEPGVGKTAIVEGLAKKILQGQVPDVLLNKKIYSLDINLLIAGAIMRGEFEARLKQVIEEVKSDPDIILFIDEVHNIIGAGSLNGAMDAANILKPALSKGELRCIGATTYKEYKKYIEEDAALERRFQAIQVNEPTLAEAEAILQGLRENYERHHLVKITDEAIEAAVRLSARYLPEKFLPDKAIDVIDEAAAGVKVNSRVVDEGGRQLKFLEEKIIALEVEKNEKVRQENYPAALKLKEQALKLTEQVLILEEKLKNKEKNWLGKVTKKEVIKVLSEMSGVPPEILWEGAEETKLLKLEEALAKRIVGQTEVLQEIAFYLKRARAGLSLTTKPLGTFMFLGPSGVGKTETAKVLAEEFFASAKNRESLIRLDMSEFSESFNISRLIGSPAGYVGYKEGGRLTEAVRKNPYAVILFDEIEKAHPQTFNLLLQILDEGYLSDATGKKIDFRNTIIVLTSNLGLREFGQSTLGFGEDGISNQKEAEEFENLKNGILKQVKEKFPPEFLNRLDKLLVFKPLALAAVEEIVELQLKKLAESLASKEITLTWTKKLANNLASQAYSPEIGARNVSRLVQEKIEKELVERILKGEIKKEEEIKVFLKGKEVEFETKKKLRN